MIPKPIVKVSLTKESFTGTNVLQPKFQTWQCFPNTQGKQECFDVFNNIGLPFTSDNKPTIQQKIVHVPVWQCDSKTCIDVYNFIGKAF
jgi:hypothetical protein